MTAAVAPPVDTDNPARNAGRKVRLVIASVLFGAVIAGAQGITECASGISVVIAEKRV